MRNYYKYLILFLVSLFIIPLNVNAECSSQRMDELNKTVNKIKIIKSFEIDSKKDFQYLVYITNQTDDVYIEDGKGNTLYGYGEKKMTYFDAGNMEFKIYSNDSNCKGQLLKKIYIELPVYNSYSQESICKDLKEFKYCRVFADTSDITMKELKKKVQEYKASKEKNNEPEPANDFYLIPILIGIGFVIDFIALIIIIRRYRQRRF